MSSALPPLLASRTSHPAMKAREKQLAIFSTDLLDRFGKTESSMAACTAARLYGILDDLIGCRCLMTSSFRLNAMQLGQLPR